MSMVACLLGLPWHSAEIAKLLCRVTQSRKLTPCSPFSMQGQSSHFWMQPPLLFLTCCFVGLNGAQHVSWPGQLLANMYKCYNCEEQLRGTLSCRCTGCFGSEQRRIGSKERWLYLYASFRCKQPLYATPSVHQAFPLSVEPFSNHQHCLVEVQMLFFIHVYTCFIHVYLYPFDNLLLLPTAITNICLK